ncbi:MAG TPA: hypothetical protein VGV40_09765 [Solirubrobacteraceae bacterium]|nr:hypothetical protein [Solirubrobacteraceae bacterium]
MSQEARGPGLSDPAGPAATLLQELRERAREEDVLGRLWRRDDTLFGPAGRPEGADRMGWLGSPAAMRAQTGDLGAFAAACADDGLERAVVLGIGGSSLAPLVFARSFAPRGLAVEVLDSSDGDALAATSAEGALVVTSSKSGGTTETRSQLEYFWKRHHDPARFVVITDPGSELEEVARERGFRRAFRNDPEIGGRYSALSFYGLVPAALHGADLDALLDFDEQHAARAGLDLGLTWAAHARDGRDKLIIRAPTAIATVGLWLEQLLAESLGKEGRGILPVADAPPGAEHGPDRQLFDATAHGFTAPEDLGRLFFTTEVATAVAGWALEVNPFDQPDVQATKDAIVDILGDLPLPDEGEAGDEDLRALLDAQPPAYLALLAFVAPSPAIDEAAATLRALLQERTGCATTFGYGPRYMHSTGQLHKGGPPTGRFLQLVHGADQDRDIPGRDFSFETLKSAQALGDLRTLRERGRPAERLRLAGEDPAADLRQLTDRLQRLL